MITGVSFPAYGARATFEMITGAADTDYPVANLSDLKKIAMPFRSSGSGAVAFSFLLPSDQPVQFVGLCRHNGLSTATWQVRLYSDTSLTAEVYDSGAVSLGVDDATLFAKTTPLVLGAPVTARAGRIDLSDIGTAWQIGGVEVAGFWDLSDATARGAGLKANDESQELGDGVTHVTRQFSPRNPTVGLDVIDYTTDGVTLMDFQTAKGLDVPFVWVRDTSDDTTWPREAVLVRNASLSPLTKNEVGLGKIALALVEHLR